MKVVKLQKLGGSVAAVIPKAFLDQLHVAGGDEVYIVEVEEGLLITPFDPEFDEAMALYERGARRYRNSLRDLER